MTTFILLRKNKEYGPFSLDDLRKMGIFHNDLVWVEGQSVCWLRPEEIKELKGIAVDEPQVQAGSVPDGLSRKVEIANDKFTANLDENNVEIQGSYSHKKPNANPGLQNAFSANYLIFERNTAEAQIPVSPFLKPNQKQHNRDLLSLFPVPVKTAAVITSLVLIGLISGILIGRNSLKKPSLVKNNQNTTTSASPEPVKASELEPIEEFTSLENENAEKISTSTTSYITETELPGKNSPVSVKKSVPVKPTGEQKESPGHPIQNNTTVIPGSDERQARNRNTEKEQAPALPDNTISHVSVVANDYLVGSFGGIKNLELTVKNDSKYNLEKVTVELQYLKPLDELLRTENIEFSAIQPFSSKTLPVSKTNRGVKVKCRVVNVVAAE